MGGQSSQAVAVELIAVLAVVEIKAASPSS
jgi:hypothetical protein